MRPQCYATNTGLPSTTVRSTRPLTSRSEKGEFFDLLGDLLRVFLGLLRLADLLGLQAVKVAHRLGQRGVVRESNAE